MTAEPSQRRLPRVGVLVPSTDTTLEQEVPLLLAGRASVHIMRMSLPDVTPEGLAVMEQDALSASLLLADISPDVVLYGCTSGSFFRGADRERELAGELAERTHAPVVPTAWAVSVALSRRGNRVRVRTPYTDGLTQAEADYLEAAGLRVTSAAGLGIVRDDDIAAVTPEQLMTLAGADDAGADDVDDADVLLLSCTNLPTLASLARVGRATGLPVVTSNTAGAEAVLGVLDGTLHPLATF